MPEIGQTISHYRIVEKIGQGGMGEVYLADDTTLDRKVALKFLPEAFTSDPERMARFEREAKLLASLNHSNIAGIYGLEQAEGNRFLVLEYVEGETLQARLSKGALPLEDALALCRQIAEGLEAAHEKGVIHRDLKPANVMITAEEKLKILDFGLAKAFADDTQSIDSSQSPTLTEAMTQPGVILGTAAYMSPEQAKGKSVDKRADIWAFGCILYECFTGKRAFEGETVTETLAAVITKEPECENAPTKTRLLLRQCLVKNPKNRLRDIGDAAVLLDFAPSTSLQNSAKKHPYLAWAWTLTASILSIALITVSVLYFYGQETKQVKCLTIETPAGLGTTFALSPDGRYIATVALKNGQRVLWLRSLAERDSRPLPGTEDAVYPFWSPDSRFIGFGAGGKLKIIDISAGYPEPLCDLPEGLLFRGGTWSSENMLVFSGAGGPLYKIPSVGGKAVAVTEIDTSRQETTHRFPSFLPDGRHFLYSVRSLSPENHGIYVGSIDLDERTRVTSVLSNALFVPPGFLLFANEGRLIAQPFNTDRLELTGKPVTIVKNYGVSVWAFSPFTVSDTDILVYRSNEDYYTRLLISMSRDGRQLDEFGPGFYNPALSADGRWIAAQRVQTETATTDIWLIDSARGFKEPLTRHASFDEHPTWSPNGNSILFSSIRDGAVRLFQIRIDGSSDEAEILDSSSMIRPTDWSQNDRFIVYMKEDTVTNTDLWALPLFGDKKPFPVANTEFKEAQGRVSPDGRWIAYSSDDSGQPEIYIQAFPDHTKRWKVTNQGGSDPKWSRAGSELCFVSADGRLMAIPIKLQDTPTFGDAVELFNAKISDPGRSGTSYDVSADGERFVLGMPIDNPNKLEIMLNWTSLLEQ